MNKPFYVLLALLISTAIILCQQTVPPDLASLVAAERAFSKMSVEKGLREAFLTYFADEGINFQPKPVKTKESIQKQPTWGTQPILVEWEPVYADVSQAGDLGYTTGPVVMTDKSPARRPTRYSTYFSIWKKQPDGNWKVVLDAGTDGPGGPPPQPSTFKSAAPSTWKSPTEVQLEVVRASLLNLDRDLLKTSGSQGFLKAFLSYLTEEARLHRSGYFPFVGRDAIRSFLSSKEMEMSWQPINSDVSQAGDLGYTYGTYELKHAQTNETEKGYYTRVWKRDNRGDWKIVLDTHNPLPTKSSESRLNRQGYQLLQEKKTKEAIEIFKQVVAEYPNSANAYDSLADAYEADGNRELAIEFAQKALDILPKDASSSQEFKNRIKDSATEKLRRLRGQ